MREQNRRVLSGNKLEGSLRESYPHSETREQSVEDIAKKIEKERLEQLLESAKKLKVKLKLKGRCHICTLPQPCKHTVA